MFRNTTCVFVLSVWVCSGQVAPGPHPAAAFPGDWLQFRGDRKLTGRSRLMGNITRPETTIANGAIPSRNLLPTISFSSEVVTLSAGTFVNSSGQTAPNQNAYLAFQNIKTSEGYTLPTFACNFYTHGPSEIQFSVSPGDTNNQNIPGLTQSLFFIADFPASQAPALPPNFSSMPTGLQHLTLALAANLESILQNTSHVVTQPSASGLSPAWSISDVVVAANSLSGAFFPPSPVLWSLYIGARQSSIALQPATGAPGTINLPATDSNAGALAANATWGIGPPTYDLNQNGNPIKFPIIDSQTKIGNFIAGSSSFQKVYFDTCGGEQAPDANCVGYGHFYQWQTGTWVEQWKTAGIPLLFFSNTIVGDFDHDGRLEVAAQPWYDIQVYDLLTGTPKTSARAVPDNVLTGRQYGWLGAYDLNGDGTQEFVALGLFENFIAVMGWQNGQLVKLWDHTIEIVHDLAQTIHATTTYPVQDINGDGILDVVTSIYNESGDGQWHVVARDGMTGNVLLDQPGRYLLGMKDVNGDGAAEMFTIATSGQLTPEYGQVDVVSFRGGTLTTLLELNGASVATQQVDQLPLNINTGNVLMDLVASPITKGGLPAFFTSRLVDAAHGTIELTPWQWSNGKLAKLGTITGPHLQVLATRPADPGSPGFLISAAVSGNNSGSIAISGVSGTVVQSSVMRAPLSSAVVGHLRPQDPPTVIVQDALDELVAFRPSSATGSGTIVWTHAGHGASTGDATGTGQNESAGALLASLTGDGTLQTLAETTGASGQARIVAIQPDGSDLWTSDFSGFPAASPAQNEPGVTLLYAGRFRNADREDVVVSTRSETITTDEINLVDGSSGQLVWNDKNGSDPSLIPAPTHDDTGFGWHAVYDWDHNGLDDLVGFTLNYWVKNGTDQNLFDRYLVSPSVAVENTIGLVFPPDSSWPTEFYPVAGIPVIGDFLNNGTDTILYGGSQYLLGLIDPLSGKGIWQSPAFPEIG